MTNSIPQPGLTSDRTLTNARVLRGQEYFVADTDETGLGAVDAVPEAGTPTSQWSEAWHYLRRRPLFWGSAVLIVLAIAIALFPGDEDGGDEGHAPRRRRRRRRTAPAG